VAVRHLQRVLGVSERFACRITGQHRATQRRESVATTPADPDATLRARLRAYARDHPRRGFRPAYHDARGEGWFVNHKKIQRLWRNLSCLVSPDSRQDCQWQVAALVRDRADCVPRGDVHFAPPGPLEG
jgi:transposase InsO family protein